MSSGKLRSGYTTGTCAAAAVKAAALYKTQSFIPEKVSLNLPAGQAVTLPVRQCMEDGKVWFAVQKDAGDDPDVTNGAWVYATVEPYGQVMSAAGEPGTGKSATGAFGTGKPAADVPAAGASAVYASEDYPNLYLTGGPGIGMVTKPGLSCPVGMYAINPVPRSMIFEAAGQIREEVEETGAWLIRIKIPEGVELAEKTFNPKLGIVGGISVLGTSGIVDPMSEKALVDTIELEIHMKAVSGQTSIILTPGNYGERFLKETLGISLKHAITCSNFVADSIEIAAREGIKRILFVGHIGKLIKVAGGVKNTHSKYGDRRMEIMADCLFCALREAGQELKKEQEQFILESNTTEEALDYLEKWGYRQQVMTYVAERIQSQLGQWAKGKIQIEVVTFSTVYGILGKSRQSDQWIEEWRRS